MLTREAAAASSAAVSAATEALESHLTRCFRRCLPSLSSKHYKGQQGRVAVFGGSDVYTGAPFFAGSAALALGADLVTVVCDPAAAVPIKSYSPELMVAPLLHLSGKEFAEHAEKWRKSMHSVVIGPGFAGTKDRAMSAADIAKEFRSLPRVIDADGVSSLCHLLQPSSGSRSGSAADAMPWTEEEGKCTVLTPNAAEAGRLAAAVEAYMGHSDGESKPSKPISIDAMFLAQNYDLSLLAPIAAPMPLPATCPTSPSSGSFAAAGKAAEEGSCPRPHLRSFGRNLLLACELPEPSGNSNKAVALARALRATVLLKGEYDLVTDGTSTAVILPLAEPSPAPASAAAPAPGSDKWEWSAGARAQVQAFFADVTSALSAEGEAGPAGKAQEGFTPPRRLPHRRIGGQGDLVAGATAAALAWVCPSKDGERLWAPLPALPPTDEARPFEEDSKGWVCVARPVLAAAVASLSVREVAASAFRERGRAVGTVDLVRKMKLLPECEEEGL